MRYRPAILLLACSMPSSCASESSHSSHLHNVWYSSSLRASSLSSEQLTQSFLTSKAEELQVSPQTLRLVKKQESLLTYHLVYELNVNDLPIANAGKELILHNRTGYSDDNIIGTYPKPLQPYESFDAYLGTKLEGIWTLKVQDVASGDAGTLVSGGLEMLATMSATDRGTADV
ncbi:MAG: proprotein convertase P-domain-containing protein [Oligoflexus sp.]|nr:proprotein convertase P-domain-containing protein [Oligoflexus sp.]